MPLQLTIENETSLPDGGPLSVSVPDGKGIDIGRDPYLDWALPDPTRTISGKHCEIRFRDGGFWLTDISRNGTFLNRNSQRMQEPSRLRDGDRIEIGRYIIAVRVDTSAAAQAGAGQGVAAGGFAPRPASPEEFWGPSGDVAPPISPRDLRPPSASRPVQADFREWAIDVPPPVSGGFAPAAPASFTADDDMGWAKGTPPPPPPAPPPMPSPRRPTAEAAAPQPASAPQASPWDNPPAAAIAPPGSDADPWGPPPSIVSRAPPPPATAPTTPGPPPAALARPAPAVAEASDWEASPVIREAPASAPRQAAAPVREAAFAPAPREAPPPSPGQAGAVGSSAGSGDLLARFAKGAGIPPEALSWRDPGDLAEEVGILVRLAAENLQKLLAARAETKRVARAGNQTTIQALDNNPLKFSPTIDDALRIMFGRPSGGYLDARRAMEQGFRDLRGHQVKTYSAMQNALRLLAHEIDPDAIEQSAEGERGLGGLLGSKKAKLWDLYVARWDALTAPHEEGMIDAFMIFFAECYDRGEKGR